MLKGLISPVQAWLLSQGRCVGCGMNLSLGAKKGDKVTCKCGRIYVADKNNTYRRARLDEA